jgi:hypothetical protein
MAKYRKKPVVIEAILFDGTNHDEIAAFGCKGEPCAEWSVAGLGVEDGPPPVVGPIDRFFDIETLEGTMRANAGDWIIRGIKGEFYPCKPDIFEATYEAVIE